MLKFDGDFDEHADGDVTCKETMIFWSVMENTARNLRTTHNFTTLDGDDFHN